MAESPQEEVRKSTGESQLNEDLLEQKTEEDRQESVESREESEVKSSEPKEQKSNEKTVSGQSPDKKDVDST